MLLLIKKGTKIHVNFGRIYMVLMLITVKSTLFMRADVGPIILTILVRFIVLAS
jgi:uncharacterized membrane protein